MESLTKVLCYSGFTYAERPYSFVWNGHVLEITTVEKTWVEPGERHFRVRTDDTLFELCYDELRDEWSISDLN